MGRRDGMVSNVGLADNMPDVTDSVQTLKTKFLHKGLTDKDLVLLTGMRHCHLPFAICQPLSLSLSYTYAYTYIH